MNNQTLRLLFDKNRDILKRLEVESVSTEYLRDDDVLLVSLGRSKTSLGIDLLENLTVHYNPSDYKIVGFTVTSCHDLFKYSIDPNTNHDEHCFKPEPIASFSMARLSLA